MLNEALDRFVAKAIEDHRPITLVNYPQGLHGSGIPGLLCVRSLTKLWSIPGVRAGYVLAEVAADRLAGSGWCGAASAA